MTQADVGNAARTAREMMPNWRHPSAVKTWSQSGKGGKFSYENKRDIHVNVHASFDAANRMRSITFTGTGTSAGSSDTSYSLSYDQNGNLTQKQNQLEPNDKTTYSWDANNRLIQMNQSKTISNNIGTGTGSAGTVGTSTSTTELSASFSYDAFGRRIQSTITQGSQAPTTVQYLYEGAQALGEIRDGKLSHRLLTGLSLDETIARIAINADGNKDAANSRLYLTDALNSVIAQLADDDNANIQNSYGYSPYGQSQTVGPDSANNPNQYTSRENDNTGLYYYRARYYDPVLKRFVSSDPIGLAGGMNSYLYAEADPLMFTDPYGLFGMADMPTLPQGAVNFGAGLGDALLFGTGGYLRESAGVDGGVNKCSDAYDYGAYAALTAGGARMAYAGLARAGSVLAASGAGASGFRAGLKSFFRGGIGKNWRSPNLAGKSDIELRMSAGKTNLGMNIWGYGVAFAAADGAAQCGCQK